MADYLVDLGEKTWFRKTVSTLGLPVPVPQSLDRGKGPWRTAELQGKVVMCGGDVASDVVSSIEEAGASVAPDAQKVHGLVFDGRNATTISDLNDLYTFFHETVRRVQTNGRVVVIARSTSADASPEAAAVSRGMTGFVKSIAKEVGRKGATANVIYVEDGADGNLAGPLRFALSARSAFVDGQVFTVSKSPKQPKKKVVWEGSLAGKTALVTGAARGIGADTARRLAEEGANVIALDMTNAEAELNELCRAIDATPLMLDITASDAIEKIKAAADKLGGLDIVVNNAGITRDKTLGNMSTDLWNMTINVNLKAALDISLAALENMKPGGRVICLSSIAGIAGNFGQTNYATAKSALIGAVEALAPQFAAKGGTINAVAPGFIETRLTKAIPFGTREAARRLANLGQGGLPVDVAELITFLATPGGAGVNGNIIRACGGNYIGA